MISTIHQIFYIIMKQCYRIAWSVERKQKGKILLQRQVKENQYFSQNVQFVAMKSEIC